jgi:hypothetical protein
MKPEEYHDLFVSNRANCPPALCALVVSLLLFVPCFFQDGLLFAACFPVGGFSLFYAIAALVLAVGLAAASLCEPSQSRAVANNVLRAAPAANVSGPEFSALRRQSNCLANVDKTGSMTVRGNGQTSYASITELRVYSMDAQHQLKIATIAREVARIS